MLSPQAQTILNHYLSLPFKGIPNLRCPYYINARARKRGALRVLTGKGLPEEIVEEAQIISVQYHHGIFDHDGDCCIYHRDEEIDEQTKQTAITKFLIDHGLGIDCSGLATHILRAHFLETRNIDLTKKFIKNIPGSWLRKIIMRFRAVENIGVKSGYANDKNTEKLGDETSGYDYKKIQTGDVIVMLETGPNNKRNHIIIITDCDGSTIHYAHSRAWSAEGQYGHGVNIGEIKITAPGQGLLKQEWAERSPALSPDLFHQVNTNETFLEAKNARVLEIRRIKT